MVRTSRIRRLGLALSLAAVVVLSVPGQASAYSTNIFTMRIGATPIDILVRWGYDGDANHWNVYQVTTGMDPSQHLEASYMNVGSFPGAADAIYKMGFRDKEVYLPYTPPYAAVYDATFYFPCPNPSKPCTIPGTHNPPSWSLNRFGSNNYFRVEIYDSKYKLTCWQDFRAIDVPTTANGHAGCR